MSKLKRVEFKDGNEKWDDAIVLAEWLFEDADGYLLLLPPKNNGMPCLVLARPLTKNTYTDANVLTLTVWSNLTKDQLFDFSMNLQKAYNEIYG